MNYTGKMDPEVIPLCDSLNTLIGISTHESCCGHGANEFRIFFDAEDFDCLGLVCYYANGCHTGQYGWQVVALSDCGARPASFMLEGPVGAYEAANKIAESIQEDR